MTFYWRWVVVRTAAAVAALVPYELLTAYTERTWGAGSASLLLSLALLLSAVPPILAETHVLRGRFPNLPTKPYVGYSLVGFALFFGVEALGTLPAVDDFFGAEGASAEGEGVKALVGLLLAIAAIPVFVICLFLPWRALGQVADGRRIWRLTVLAAVLGMIVMTLLVLMTSDSGLEIDYSTWPNVLIQFASGVAGELTYALISGIGVARLRPKPEAAP